MKKKLSIITLSIALASSLMARDIGLGEAYEMALANDEGLKSMMYETMAASERVWQSTALLLPSVELGFSYNGERYDKEYPGRDKTRMDESFYRYGITLRQQILRPDLWISRIQEGIREQSYQVAHENTKQELASRVARAYFNLAFANKNLELSLSYEEANKAKYDQMEKQLQMGLANKMDTLEAKVRYDQAQLDVSRARRQIEVARLELAKLIGEPVGIKNDVETIKLDFFDNLSLEKYENILENFEYKQSELASQVAIKEKQKRVAEFSPTADFSISYSNNRYKDKASFGNENRKVETMVRFTLPIFNSGHTYSRVQEGEYLKMSSLSKQLDTTKKVEIDQKTAVSEYKNYLAQMKIMLSALETARLYETAIERGYSEGLRSIVELFDARARVYKTRIDALNTGHELVLGYINLEYLIGNVSTDTIHRLDRVFNQL